jgi:WD40 repeat protein
MNTEKPNKPSFRLARVGESEELYQQAEIIMLNGEQPARTMNRRDFIGTSITATAALAFLNGCSPEAQNVTTGKYPTIGTRGPLLNAHKEGVCSVCISQDGTLLASNDYGGVIKIWSLAEGRLLKKLNSQDRSCGNLIIYAENDPQTNLAKQKLISGIRYGDIRVWTLPDGELLKTLKGHIKNVPRNYAIHASADGRLLAAGFSKGEINVWNNGEVKTLPTSPHVGIISAVWISSSGDLLAISSAGAIALWELPDGKLKKWLHTRDDRIVTITMSPNGKLLVAGKNNGYVDLWNLPDGNLIKSLHVTNNVLPVRAVAISPDNKCLVAGDDKANIRLWSLPEGTLVKTLQGHTDYISSISISPDGKFFASGSYDKTIRLWSLPDGELISCLADLEDSPDSVKGAVFSVANGTGGMITYTLPCGSAIPAGATCSCNCVPGSIKPPPPVRRCSHSSNTSRPSGGRGGGRCICMAVRCR